MNRDLLAAALMAVTITAAAGAGTHRRRAHRAREITRARHTLRAAPRVIPWPSCRRLRRACVRLIYDRPCARFCGRKCWVFHGALRGAQQARQAGHRSRQPGGRRHAPRWRDPHREVSRQPGLRHAPGRPERREFHPGRRQEPIARSLDPAMAHGRRPATRAAAAGDRRRETRSCR
jgi:hypothetical protein